MRRLRGMAIWAGLACSLLATGPAAAQNAVGSPSGTITLDGSQLPPQPLPFGGKIENDALQSTPWWPPCHDTGP